MATQAMLTTIDNPHNPFTDYQAWYAWDLAAGYHTPGFLARVAVVSDALSPADQELAVEQAIDEIVAENVTGVYVKVTREVEDEDENLVVDELTIPGLEDI